MISPLQQGRETNVGASERRTGRREGAFDAPVDAEHSIVRYRRRTRTREHINVGEGEQVASMILGGLALLSGLKIVGRRHPLVGLAVAGAGAAVAWRGFTGDCRAYRALGVTHEDATPLSHPLSRHVEARGSVTVNASPQRLYDFWRDFGNLPRVMPHLISVEPLGEMRTRWTAHGLLDRIVSWEAATTADVPGELIAWRSVPDTRVENGGEVTFRPATGGRGTVVDVSIDFKPPGGVADVAIAKIMGRDPTVLLREELAKFKQLIEAGEIATVEGQPQGRCGAGARGESLKGGTREEGWQRGGRRGRV